MTSAEKTMLLFQYIKELGALKTKVAKNLKNQYWYKAVADLPTYQDYLVYTPMEQVLLTLRKPDVVPCPPVEGVFQEWLEPGWEKFRKEVSVRSQKTGGQSTLGRPALQQFADDEQRVTAFQAWKSKRDIWAEEESRRNEVRQLFRELHRLYMALEREGESLEFVVGNGLLTDRQDRDMCYPILTKRVKLCLDAEENIFTVTHTDQESAVNRMLLTGLEHIDYQAVQAVVEHLGQEGHQPCDTQSMREDLRYVAHLISPNSRYLETGEMGSAERIAVANDPVFLIQRRADTTQRALEAIIDHIGKTQSVPPHLVELVEGGKRVIEPQESGRRGLAQQLAAVGGEDEDILLSKETNKEQLEIAQRIARYHAVLVQGPPGTGKTHTIANLLGHFLSEGKSVLVASQTKKALSVLKDKVPSDLQDLCVSVLEDSNSDMEQAVDGIAEMLATHTVESLQDKMEEASQGRQEVIRGLVQVRKKIHQIKLAEAKLNSLCGESLTVSDMAQFVFQHQDSLSYIPGVVTLNHPLPLSKHQLEELYQSNGHITAEEEAILNKGLPSPDSILSGTDFTASIQRLTLWAKTSKEALDNAQAKVEQLLDGKIGFHFPSGRIDCGQPELHTVRGLKTWVQALPKQEPWVIYAMADGKKGGGYVEIWTQLCESIQSLHSYASNVVEPLFGQEIQVTAQLSTDLLLEGLEKMKLLYQEKEKISRWERLMDKQIELIEQGIRLNGNPVGSAQDCVLVMQYLELSKLREHCAGYWNQLMASRGLPLFADLDEKAPEEIALQFVDYIQWSIGWYQKEYPRFEQFIQHMDIDSAILLPYQTLDSDAEHLTTLVQTSQTTLQTIVCVLEQMLLIRMEEARLQEIYQVHFAQWRGYAPVCEALYTSYQDRDTEAYQQAYEALCLLWEKSGLHAQRSSYLSRIRKVAPDWTRALVQRTGVHGQDSLPEDIEGAWRWKQYEGWLNDLASESFRGLQKQSEALSQAYRSKTAQLAKWRAWYHLKVKIEENLDMKMALMGWKLTVKKLGRGTGKLAPLLREQARAQMSQCQGAVPVWIMTVNRVLEHFVPGTNQFDVVILDEASQSDLSALAITYMAEKVIVVGDDQQVSPVAVGVDLTKVNQLATGSIKDIIPNWHLYTSNTSIYDIVSTVYPALMLREHFRCVPDIIGFSNQLCYDHKIKPLRDTSDCKLLPAVVNYPTKGQRLPGKKTNPVEAQTVVALMASCMAQEAYQGKTIGVISLLGEDQARLIEQLMFEQIDTAKLEGHRVLCGTSAQFQGDERDVIFISLVDSNGGEDPLALLSEGVDHSTRKRYNVAASRGKEQLWVVHSLDVTRDLKTEDMRRKLIEYATDPKAFWKPAGGGAEQTDPSPLEQAVAQDLLNQGYDLVQQWPVGHYQIAMVVKDGDQRVAVECDGPGDQGRTDHLKQEMERQTILERLGWRFIRLRGSAYYRNPAFSMAALYQALAGYQIFPHGQQSQSEGATGVLLAQVTAQAEELLQATQIG